jgi:two-component system, OmpR family, sensor kinase
MRRGLTFRLFAAILAAVLVAVSASLVIGVLTARDALRDSASEDLSRLADNLARNPDLALQQAQPPPAAPGQPPKPPAGPAPLVVSKSEAASLLPADAVSALDSSGSADGDAEIAGRHQLFAARELPDQTVLIVTRPDDFGTLGAGAALGGLLLASAIGIALAALAAGLLSPRLAAPMRRAAAAARQLATGQAPNQLAPEGPREAVELSESINDLAVQLEKARAAERAVLLSVSHELRTPLTAIRGYAEALGDGTMRTDEAAPVIITEANGLDLVVQDLLALARLDQGILRVRDEDVDLVAVCSEAARRFAIEAERRGVSLSVLADGPGRARADRGRVLQVISNLIDNALRVTPSGGSVTIRPAPGRVVIEDTGPGIPEEDQPRAFERFHLHERQGSGDGTGIGLAIVRELTELMGGSVRLTSTPGSGATFTLTYPEPGSPTQS